MNAAAQLKSLLERLTYRDDAAARREADRFVEGHSEEELIAMEEELVAGGMPAEHMRGLCASHKHAACGTHSGFRATLPDGHVLATFMDEHQRILAKLARLAALTVHPTYEPARRAELEEIRTLGDQLIGVEPHHQREEQVLFPALRARGLHGPPAVMEAEHVELRALKHAVRDGAESVLGGATEAWPKLRGQATELVSMLRDHIGKEDEILYPAAAQRITDPTEWADMKRRCDAIGYCCSHHHA